MPMPFKSIGARQVFRSLQHMARGIQQLKKLPGDIHPVYVLRVGFGGEVGENRASRLLDLTIELARNLMS